MQSGQRLYIRFLSVVSAIGHSLKWAYNAFCFASFIPFLFKDTDNWIDAGGDSADCRDATRDGDGLNYADCGGDDCTYAGNWTVIVGIVAVVATGSWMEGAMEMVVKTEMGKM